MWKNYNIEKSDSTEEGMMLIKKCYDDIVQAKRMLLRLLEAMM